MYDRLVVRNNAALDLCKVLSFEVLVWGNGSAVFAECSAAHVKLDHLTCVDEVHFDDVSKVFFCAILS